MSGMSVSEFWKWSASQSEMQALWLETHTLQAIASLAFYDIVKMTLGRKWPWVPWLNWWQPRQASNGNHVLHVAGLGPTFPLQIIQSAVIEDGRFAGGHPAPGSVDRIAGWPEAGIGASNAIAFGEFHQVGVAVHGGNPVHKVWQLFGIKREDRIRVSAGNAVDGQQVIFVWQQPLFLAKKLRHVAVCRVLDQ